jgi:beta-glucosidase
MVASFFLLLVISSGVSFARDSSPTPTPADAAYKNPALPVDQRVENLLSRMTQDEKIGQMTLVEKNSVVPDAITQYALGGLLSGGGGYPRGNNTPQGWLDMVNSFQQYALKTRLSIPIIYGVDAVHGHNDVQGTTIFPHNIGMGATGNADLVKQACRATAEEVVATGIRWDYGPVVAVPQDIRWGRTYEGYSENTDLVTKLGTACVEGLQGSSLSDPTSVLATPKHFIGDGGTAWGTSTTSNYKLDQGVTSVDEPTLRALFLPPYQSVVQKGAMSIMVSFSSWQTTKMHAQKYLLTDVLKGELGFKGFLVSDWGGIDQISPDYYRAVVAAINAGVDMNMVPSKYKVFIDTMTQAISKGDISMERVDDAVRRILTVKFALGLFEHPTQDGSLLAGVGSDAHRQLARETVSQSLVLLKNEDKALPLAKNTPHIFVAGKGANDIGMQSGGWTIEWQGKMGPITSGTTILDGILHTVADPSAVTYDPVGQFADARDASGSPLNADVGIVVVGEQPYAEGEGDSADLALSGLDVRLIQRVRPRVNKLVVILLSGRPLIINDALDASDAFVAAWLPGTEGQGVADDLFGDHAFSGKLPYTWPRSVDQLPFDFARLPTSGDGAPLFPFAYGLTPS